MSKKVTKNHSFLGQAKEAAPEVAFGLVLRLKYRLEGNHILLAPPQEWLTPDWLKNQTRDPFEEYYQGKKPHLDFVNLTRDPKPQKVLEFINTRGLPKPDMNRLDQMIHEAHCMRDHVQLVGLLKRIPDSEILPDSKVVEKIRAHIVEMQQTGRLQFFDEASLQSAETAIQQLLSRWAKHVPRAALPSYVRFERNLAKLPDDGLIAFARSYTQHTFYHFLKPASPFLGFYQGRLTPRFAAPDLLTALYVMWFLDLTKENRVKICRRPKCAKVFLSTRKDQIYCSRQCTHAEVVRLSRLKTKTQKSKKGGKRHGRVSKK